MLPNDYSHEYPGQRHSSFAGSPIINQEVERVAYHNVNESTLMPFTAAVSGSSGKDDVPIISDFNFGATSPPTIYSVNSVSSATVDPMTLVKVNTPIDQNDMMKDLWWPENLGGDQSEYHDDVCGLSMLYDGLPRIQTQQQQHYSDLWVTNNSSSCGWTAQSSTTAAAIAPITMSPKALTLSASTAPVLSFESSRGLVLLPTGLSSASSLVSSCRQDTPESVPEILQVVEPPPLGAFRRHRQILPECLPQSCNASILPSNESTSRDTTQKRTVKSKPRSCSFRNLSPPARGKLRLLFASTHSQKADVTDVETLWPRRIEPKRAAASSSPSAQAEHHRNARDDFLIKSKLAGMSYKDIRRQGNFSEAESTLRGRFRTLTKHKTARVRKPEWSDNDVSISSLLIRSQLTFMEVRLLKKAVRKLTSGSDIAKGKVPWKLVAEYIANNGGSYHFGNATCRKRWDELPVKVRS